MCGIAGIFAVWGESAELEGEVAAMTATLRHRGPDDDGLASGAGWAMGMRRLAVQDLSAAGHQPMSHGNLTIVFNGEVYNFPELRAELERAGHRFRSHSDTEVVLHAFERWGTDAFDRFNGMFALAIVDSARRTAWLARDRFGKKPLFLARIGDRLLFASELKALLAVAADHLTLSRIALAQYFRFGYVPGPRSIFEQVEKLPPASWLAVDLDGATASPPTRFWRAPAPERRTVSVEELLATLRESVRRRLIADVPVGAFLSGGTDSSLVVAAMSDIGADVRTFSIGFPSPGFDESRYALAVARRFGANHTHHQLDPAEALALVPSMADTYDEPLADSSVLPTMAVSRTAREHVTVALSGDGGDELFGGYPWYRSSRSLALAKRVPGVIARLPSLGGHSKLANKLWLLRMLAPAPSDAAAYQELISVWHTKELARLLPDVPGFASYCAPGPEEHGARSRVEQMMRWDTGHYLIDDILQKVDRASMSVSLEVRNPLLDPSIVDLGLAALGRAENAPGLKPLLRDALRTSLASEIVDRPKQGFIAPIGGWLRNELRELVEDLVLARRDAEYDASAAHALCRDHLAARCEAPNQVWSLLAFELWRERWLA